MYEERVYRKQMQPKDLVQFNVTEYESDLQVFAKNYLEKEARLLIKKYREDIINYIHKYPEFLNSLTPMEAAPEAPDIVRHMCFASQLAGVGPMAAVAGALSQYVGRELHRYSDEVILENGGDIYICSKTERQILIYAGSSPFSNKIALKIPAGALGVCTSSGTVGHSLSFGRADAVVVVAEDTLISDAAATSIGNIIKSPSDIEKGIAAANAISGVDGVIIIVGDKLGAWGKVNLVKVS